MVFNTPGSGAVGDHIEREIILGYNTVLDFSYRCASIKANKKSEDLKNRYQNAMNRL